MKAHVFGPEQRAGAARVIVGLAVALTLVGCGGDGTGPDLPEQIEVDLSGRVYTVDGRAPVSVMVAVTSQAGQTTVAVAADGTFRLRAQVAGDTVDYVISGTGADSLYHPSLIRTTVDQVPTLRAILIPRRWTIDRGRYRGRTVEISPDAAFRAPCEDPNDINCDGFYPRVWITGTKAWRADALPIPVAFDRDRSTDPIGAADSAAYWEIVDQMNADFGTTLFRPAAYTDLQKTTDGRALGAVLVRVDNSLSGFGAWTNWWWNADGEMWSGLIRLRHSGHFDNVGLMTHELLHTLGFKHSCSWPTVMGGYGCSSFPGLSPEDVAYAQLALAVNARQRETGAPHGLIAALQGERILTLKLPPFTAPDVARLRELRVDGVAEGLPLLRAEADRGSLVRSH